MHVSLSQHSEDKADFFVSFENDVHMHLYVVSLDAKFAKCSHALNHWQSACF